MYAGKDLDTDYWLGKQVDKYKIVKLLGCGGIGAVYQAIHIDNGQAFVVKILFPYIISPNQQLKFVEQAKSFLVLDHPNIVRLYSIQRCQDSFFIAIEYVEGKTVAQVLENNMQIPIKIVIDIAIKTLHALTYLHANKIIHDNIKPANIIIDDNGEVKVTDFGLLRCVKPLGFLTSSSTNIISPIYNSPEYILHEPTTDQTDQYSLGVTLFHMLTGNPPFIGKTPMATSLQHLSGHIPSIRNKRPDAPEGLQFLIKKMLAKKPKDRFANLMEIVQILEQCLSRLPHEHAHSDLLPKTQTPSPLPQTQNKPNRIKVLIVDDSRMICEMIYKVLAASGNFEVVGIVHSGQEALRAIPHLQPQVITLDINMPEMDGITTLKWTMVRHPLPIIMLSAFAYEGALLSFHCLSAGAVDFVWKPSYASKDIFQDVLEVKVMRAAELKVLMPKKPRIPKSHTNRYRKPFSKPAEWLVVMMGGEGGYNAYLKIVPYILKNIPCAIVALQEMESADFTSLFVDYLDNYSKMEVKKIERKEMLAEGKCYLNDHHSAISLIAAPDAVYIDKTEQMAGANSFDYTLAMAASIYGSQTVAVVLSGQQMNSLANLQAIKHKGGIVLAQIPETCMNPEAPTAVIEAGIVEKGVPEVDIPAILWHLLKRT